MTRELKLALIVGFALVLTVAILVSDHLSKARTSSIANVSGAAKAQAKAPEQPIRGLEEILPASMPAAMSVTAPTTGDASGAPEQKVAAAEPLTSVPLVIGQGSAGAGRESKFGPGRQENSGSLSESIRQHSDTATLASGAPSAGTTIPPGGTPQDLIKKVGEQPKPTQVATGEKTHKVSEGDSLYSISKKYYNDGMLWKKLAAANAGKVSESGALKVGSTITIPSKEVLTGKHEATKPDVKLAANIKAKPEVKPEPKAVKTEESKNKSYQVRPGDTLTNIARVQLGSASRSGEIASLNRMDPDDDLLAGAILKLPSR